MGRKKGTATGRSTTQKKNTKPKGGEEKSVGVALGVMELSRGASLGVVTGWRKKKGGEVGDSPHRAPKCPGDVFSGGAAD